MTCEMAQRIIALAALAPAHTRHVAAPGREAGFPSDSSTERRNEWLEAEALAQFQADLLDEDLLDLTTEIEAERQSGPAMAADRALDPSAFGEAELPESERLALEAHLAGCRECQAEMASTAAFYRALSLTRQPEPTPSLLARARLRLDTTLDNNAHQSVIAHLLQQLSFSAGRLRASPGLASGLLLLGLSVGGYAGYHAGHAAHNREQRVLVLERPPLIVHVNSIVRDPDSEQVEVHYDRLEPDTLSGSLDDPAVRTLLMLAMQRGDDPEVRTNSFDLLASECRHGHACDGGPLRSELVKVLRSDHNPQVRMEALGGLEPYIAQDMQVRDAVVRSMMADKSAEVRIEAIRLLTPVDVDSSVRQALHNVAAKDGDPLIRNASQQVLNGTPQMQ